MAPKIDDILGHLLEDDINSVPDIPELPVLEKTQYLSGTGIKVSQTGDDVMLSATEDEGGGGGGGGASTFIDPLAYMSFRSFLTNNTVLVRDSWVDSMYYEDGGWLHEEFKMDSETLPITVFPQFLYLKFPVKWVSGKALGAGNPFPVQNFASDPQNINSTSVTFAEVITTGYISRNRTATPANYFVLSQIAESDVTLTLSDDGTEGTGFWHFLIATVNQGSLQQHHLGIKTLPQAFNFNIVTFNANTT